MGVVFFSNLWMFSGRDRTMGESDICWREKISKPEQKNFPGELSKIDEKIMNGSDNEPFGNGQEQWPKGLSGRGHP